MKRFPGHKLAFLGLFAGLAFGLAVTIFKHWLSNEIIDSIEDEVKASCPTCSLAFDTFSLSFSTLTGKATNVRILKEGQVKLSFSELRGAFSIRDIAEKRVYLTSLNLFNGIADGVGPDSVTFKFIDQLTTPLPPELAKPNRWRITLDRLLIHSADFREPLGKNELLGKGFSLLVERRGEAFSLSPKVQSLTYRGFDRLTNQFNQTLPLGDLSAELLIDNGVTTFTDLRVGRDQSGVSIDGNLNSTIGNYCSGEGDVTIQAQYIGLPTWLTGKVRGSTAVKGHISSPIFEGDLSGTEDLFSVIFPLATPLQFQSTQGAYSIDIRKGDPLVTVHALRGRSENATVELLSPLTFSSDGLTAAFKGNVQQFDYGPFTVKNAEVLLNVMPHGYSTATHVELSVENFYSNGIVIGPSYIILDLLDGELLYDVKNRDNRQGAFHAFGKVILPTETTPATIQEGEISMEGFRYPLSLPVSPDYLSPVALTSKFKISGPIDLTLLTGNGDVSVAFPALKDEAKAAGTASLRDGMLTVELNKNTYGGNAKMRLDVAKNFNGTFQASLTQSSLSHFVDGAACSDFQGTMEYSFPLSKPLEGNGILSLDALTLGCAPYSLAATNGKRLPISNGALQLEGLTINGVNSSLKLKGNAGIARGYNVAIEGDVYLSAFLPFLPAIDNLQGALSTKLQIKGALSEPQLTGTLALSKGEIGVVEPDVTIKEAKGSFEILKSSVLVKDLKGLINEGELEIRGSLIPNNLAESELIASFSNVVVTPMENTTLTLGGEITVRKGDSGTTILAGDITIPSAEISRDIDPNKMVVQAITGYLLSSPSISPRISTAPSNIELDINVHAARNIFILTPFLSAEFNSQVRVRGTVAQPAISGEMQVLNGWLGIKDNRFDITSGAVTFKPGALEPNLSMVGEGTLRSNTGENILVILEANGPISNPRVSLTSDQGLSNDELLVLLTASRSLTGRTMANTVGRQLGMEQRFLLSPDSFDSFGSFFKNLTRIDSLSVEPIFNPFSGQTEPAVVGRKNIAERLTLAGQSTLGAIQNARAGLVYNLTSSLNASGFIESVPSRQNTALRADLTYTVLAQQTEFLKIDVTGAFQLNKEDVISAARLGPASRIKNTEAVLENIARDISEYCLNQGYMNGEVSVICLQGDEYCSHLSIVLAEGSRFTISSLEFEGDPLPEASKKVLEELTIKGAIASASLLAEVESTIVVAVRNEGYVAARISVRRGVPINQSEFPLVVTVDLREPVSFTFSGNTLFSPEEFLNSIELFSRKRPFGNNTIQLLINHIERMYQEKGYLYVQVHFTTTKTADNRVTYNIVVTEGERLSVRNLLFEGNAKLTRDEIIDVMKEMGFSAQISLLSPSVAIPDQLEALRESLATVYQHEGYSETEISYEIKPTENNGSIDIAFTIKEGNGVQIQAVRTSGYPQEIALPVLLTTPASIPRINKYITLLLDTLKDSGYLTPSISTTPTDDGAVEIFVEAGTRTFIQEVVYDGLTKVSQATLDGYSRLKSSDPYTQNAVNETKRLLLRSGLFSRVEIEPSDGKLDQPEEKVTIRVVERPLKTLEVGGGANSEFGIHVFGEAVDKSLFADGQSIALRLDSYFSNSSVDTPQGFGVSQGFSSIRYVNPNILGSDFSFSEELRYQRQDVTTFEFNQDRLSLASYLYASLSRGITLSAGHTVLLDDLRSVTPSAVLSPLDSGTTRLGFLSAVLAVDRRDDPLIPQEGFTFTLEPKFASKALGSEADYASMITRGSMILPLDRALPRFSLGLSGAAGAAFTYGNTEVIPITQRYYLGGRTTVRGFRENSLGPRAADGAVLGGDTLLMLKTQLQYLATTNITTHVFLDAGNVFLRDESFDLSDTRMSAGVGFRFLSPIGPLGIDVGHPLDERGGEPSFRVHFSVGSAF